MANNSTTNKRITNAIKAAIILITFAITFIAIDKIFLIKSEDGIEQMHSYYKQPEGTVDALFVGSSHIFCHVNTGVLWDEYGISAFDLAGAEQPFWNSYYYIKEALKTQTPKVIVLEITTPGIRPIDFQPENWLITNTYGIKWNENKYNAIKDSALDNSFDRLILPINTTHGRYVDLTEDDFVDYNNSINYKGFDPRETTEVFDRPDISGVTERASISEKEEKYLRLIIDFVKEKNVPLLFISSPYVVTAEEQAKYNTIFDIATENDIPYIDFNKLYDEMELDFSTDLAEVLHLNRSGNEKFTRYLGSCLKEQYELEDHRNDSKYVSWDWDALYQRQDTKAYELTQATYNADIGTYFNILNNDNYVIYCNIPNDCDTVAYAELITENSVISKDMLIPGAAYIINSGTTVFSSDEGEFKAAIEDGNRSVLFTRTTDEYGNVSTVVKTNGSRTSDSVTGYENYSMSNEGISFTVYDTVLDKIVGTYTL